MLEIMADSVGVLMIDPASSRYVHLPVAPAATFSCILGTRAVRCEIYFQARRRVHKRACCELPTWGAPLYQKEGASFAELQELSCNRADAGWYRSYQYDEEG